MIRIANGFFSGGGNVRLANLNQHPAHAPQLAQAPMPPMSKRVEDARTMRDNAVQNLQSAEDHLAVLDFTMGPEAALQAIDEAKASVDRAQQEYDRVLAEESATR